MVKVFENRRQTVTQIVEDSLDVAADGSVTFRAGLGKGSGRPIQIPAEEFDGFVALINETAATREAKARQAATEVVSTTESTDSTDSE